jgi:hypothetical protein
MLRLAAGILDLELQAAKWAGFKIPQDKKLQTALYLGLVQSPILATVALTPYYQMYKSHAAMTWAVRDTMWTRAVKKTGAFGGKYNTYTLFNYYPKMGQFAQRGGWRFAATKVGSRFIPYVGWALLALDLYSVGKWVHGKTRWGNPTPGP